MLSTKVNGVGGLACSAAGARQNEHGGAGHGQPCGDLYAGGGVGSEMQVAERRRHHDDGKKLGTGRNDAGVLPVTNIASRKAVAADLLRQFW